jgi:hypothetical protein
MHSRREMEGAVLPCRLRYQVVRVDDMTLGNLVGRGHGFTRRSDAERHRSFMHYNFPFLNYEVRSYLSVYPPFV